MCSSGFHANTLTVITSPASARSSATRNPPNQKETEYMTKMEKYTIPILNPRLAPFFAPILLACSRCRVYLWTQDAVEWFLSVTTYQVNVMAHHSLKKSAGDGTQLRRFLSPRDLLVFSSKGHDSTYRGQDLLSHSPGCRVRILLQI